VLKSRCCRGDLGKGGGEILWLKGDFIYIAADGSQAPLQAPAYISLPGNTAHALKCGKDPCMFYLKYARPFDLHVRQMPAAKH
jgi:hypothetical protein